LSKFFDHVTASDGSAEQISQATPDPKITYRVEQADKSSLPNTSQDLVTVAQAVHWFPHDAFYHEVKRVLKKDGVIAVWTYDLLSCQDADIMDCLNSFFELIEPFWPLQRDYVRTGYKTLPFPFDKEVMPPSFIMQTDWSKEQLIGYFQSWSAVKYFTQKHNINPIKEFEKHLERIWPSHSATMSFDFPIAMRVARF
jgi:SAM-dependent methyltransferase